MEGTDFMRDMMLSELQDYKEDPNQDSFALAEQFYLSVMAGINPPEKALQWLAVALNRYVNQESPDRQNSRSQKAKKLTLDQLLGFTPVGPGKRKAALTRANTQRDAQIALFLDESMQGGMAKNKALNSASAKFGLNRDDVEKIYKRRKKLIAPYIVGAELP